MMFRAVSSLALMALAGQAIAEPIRQPYKAEYARMSTRNLFGLERRQNEGYSPEQQFCGAGNTCAEACGKGFEQCASNDGVVHCFDTSAKQTCCPGTTGDSCDEGYFCSADEKGATWCCPDSMTLKECAAAYNLPDTLVSETKPGPTTSTKSPPKSTPAPASTTGNSSSVVKASTTQTAVSKTTSESASKSAPQVTLEATSSASASASASASKEGVTSSASELSPTAITASRNGTASTSTGATPTAPDNGFVTAGSDSTHAPIGGMVLMAAAAFAALV
ncbi:hypothetical protein GGS23DRAFT_33115 [Durotheca rogersii]|uniref:uncharacterized protein n=1 Tax=Durotheca rogersii TaxID=419775 RepID=UPI00222018AE|nr:uncharacterized protein GGS23DRAFT_33115 [Durotheca rogersii]KAI5868483.1 hypothetical protein GGS23DRAFT_33115 [Durotheca rogersii]